MLISYRGFKMHKIVLFGGTTEGRLLTEFLSENGIPAIVCVATDYGEEVLNYDDPVLVRSGRLKPDAMRELFKNEKTEIVFDATHPYATGITGSIKKVCSHENIEYVRVLRESVDMEGVIEFSKMEDLISYLNESDGVIFSSMGAKEAGELTKVNNFKERVYLRMLPSPEGMKTCLDLGYSMKNLCGMQGPFSKEFNKAQFKEVNADILITKESGNAGGFLEKTEAARECGMEVLVLARVDESGIAMDEAKQIIKDRFKDNL